MFLICENVEDSRFIIEEGSEGKPRKLYLEGTFLQGNIKNRNGRIYDSDLLENEIKRYMGENVKSKRAFGELGHPQGPTINLDRVCILHENVKREGDNFIGKARVLTELPMGKIVEGYIKEGCQLGVSSRGMGSLKMVEGIQRVQPDFRLATLADVVADPSAPDAFVNGIMEGRSWIFDAISGTWAEQGVEKLAEDMKKMPAKTINENLIPLFERFMKTLSNRKSDA
jgi:hypothetical protein